MGNEVEIVVKSTDKASAGFNSATSSMEKFKASVREATERTREGFDKVDTGAMGFRDTITGVQDTMTGLQALMGQGSMASATLGDKLFMLGAGIGDLASGFANLIVPVIGAATALSAQAAAAGVSVTSLVAQKVAMVASAAATGVMTAAQWLLNAAMDANPIGIVVVAIAALVGGLVLAYNKSETFRSIVQAVGSVLSDVVWPALKKVGEVIWNVVGPAFEMVGNAISKTWGFLKRLVGVTDDATQAENDHKKSLEQAKAASDAYTNALNAQADAARKAAGKALDLRSAERNYQQAIDDATQSVKDNGKTLDIHTEKGRKNQEALDRIASATNDLIDATLASGGSQQDVSRIMDQGRSAYTKTGAVMGDVAGRARDLSNRLIGIPRDIQINLIARDNATRVINGVYQRMQWINGMTSYVNVVSTNANAREDRAHGGVTGAAASGGPRSGRILAGEFGPELIDVAPGSMVHTAGDTAQMLAGGGARSGVVQLEWVGADSGDDFMAFLRKNIRIRGGVQAALG